MYDIITKNEILKSLGINPGLVKKIRWYKNSVNVEYLDGTLVKFKIHKNVSNQMS